MINSPVHTHTLVIAVNMFVKKENSWLVLKRSPKKEICPNIYHAVGGKLELGEDPLQGAIRELKEETGLAGKNHRLEAIITEVFPPDHPEYNTVWQIYYFSCDYVSGELQQSDEGTLSWMSEHDLLRLTADELFPSLKETIHHIINSHDGVVFARFEYNKETHILNKDITVCPR